MKCKKCNEDMTWQEEATKLEICCDCWVDNNTLPVYGHCKHCNSNVVNDCGNWLTCYHTSRRIGEETPSDWEMLIV